MLSIALALALFAQDASGQAPAAADPVTTSAEAPADRWPTGAPREDYQFVAWCYGALRGYVDLHDQVMPEVTRIETTYRKPGTKVEDDLKVYAQMYADSRVKLGEFQAALTSAEKASVRPMNTVGANSVKQGRQIWAAGPGVTKARLAQEWMSWTLPARCETSAKTLQEKSTLMGATLKANTPN